STWPARSAPPRRCRRGRPTAAAGTPAVTRVRPAAARSTILGPGPPKTSLARRNRRLPAGDTPGAGYPAGDDCRRRPARLVPRARPRPALAPPGRRAVGGAGQRDHAAADAGGQGAAGVPCLAGPLAHSGGPGRGSARRGGSDVGQARLPAARPAAARVAGGPRPPAPRGRTG